MLRKLFAEQSTTECPFESSKDLRELNHLILNATGKYIPKRHLALEEMIKLHEDCHRLEQEAKRLHGEAKIYADRTLDLGNLVMSGRG